MFIALLSFRCSASHRLRRPLRARRDHLLPGIPGVAGLRATPRSDSRDIQSTIETTSAAPRALGDTRLPSRGNARGTADMLPRRAAGSLIDRLRMHEAR